MNCRIPKLGLLIIVRVTDASGAAAIWVILLMILHQPRGSVSLLDGDLVAGEVRPNFFDRLP